MLLLSSPAQAHNELEQATPADGASLKKLPDNQVLVFSEEVSPRDLTIRTQGAKLPVNAIPGRPRAVQVDLRSVEPARTVQLAWKVIDEHDGHESSGTLTLHVRGTDPATTPKQEAASPPQEPRAIGWVSATARGLGYLATAVLLGGLLFISLLWQAGAEERRAGVLLTLSLVAGIVAAAADVAVVVSRAGGGTTLVQALTEDFGRVYSAMALLWVLAAVVVVGVLQGGEAVVRRPAWRVGALVVAAGLVRTTGMNTHATQTTDPAWGIAADFLHVSAVSAWIGGLTVLSVCLLPRRRLAELEDVVPKFSRVALLSVLLIVTSGLILFWQVVGSVDGFWATHYARVLMVKMTLFALVLLAAMKSKRWVEKSMASAVADRRRTAVGSLAASVAAETVLVVAVLGAAGVLVTSSPGV
jgi:copper transport protein